MTSAKVKAADFESAEGERAAAPVPAMTARVLTLGDIAEDHQTLQALKREVEEMRAILATFGRRGMTVKQAAEAEGVSEKTIRRQIDAGELQHRRHGSRIVVYLARQSALRISSDDGS